jgi:thiol-disulfide isomerase/thioredoxin
MTQLKPSMPGAAAIGTLALLLAASPADAASPRQMPSFSRASEWVNSPPLTPAALRGKVVLIQFWTYTCINWLRTLSYVRTWAEKYKPHGLVVIGVHSPEFEVEKNLENVRRAAKQLRVGHPFVIDNDFAIWRAYDNHYWPALYIADAEGRIRYHHFGEGRYEQTEKMIQRLLAEAGNRNVPEAFIPVSGHGVEADADWSNLGSPETYLGSERTENFSSSTEKLRLNHWTRSGDWTVGRQSIVLQKPNGRIAYRFHARDLHLVMGARHGERVRMRVLIDGRPPGAAHGADVNAQGHGVVMEPRLYQLIRQSKPILDRTFEIEFLDSGVEALVFTFG